MTDAPMNTPEMTPFTSVLVANRGEIACRIMRTARAAGLRCVAVHTQADADSPHVAMADQAVCIGEGPVGDSYLSLDRILKAARDAGVQAIHPGYGFLSESAEFARACGDAGLVFVGPSAEAIAVMGNKAAAKRNMIAANVPCVPGYEGADQSDETLGGEADRIGYPVMIKAAAGGGGRGMRLVADPGDFLSALHLARAEALSAFGSDEMILEKAVQNPRHVEVQIMADRHGTTLHLGERDCSVQRRHQKVIEEAPSPAVSAELRSRMGAAAINAAQAVGYVGAGTVEFLLDAEGAFYFLEMNTRLQVEHPVTELVTGLDLVDMQLRVARGERLPMTQQDLQLDGHAIEARLYAEDPAQGFMPQSGAILAWVPPSGPGVRVDGGIVQGQRISPHYDPMLAKIIAHGATREQALQRLTRALEDMVLLGVTCNRDVLIRVIAHPGFADGTATTGFLAQAPEVLDTPALTETEQAMVAAVIHQQRQGAAAGRAGGVPAELLGWSSTGSLIRDARLVVADTVYAAQVVQTPSTLSVHVDGREHRIVGEGIDLRIDGMDMGLRCVHATRDEWHVATKQRSFTIRQEQVAGEGADPGLDGRIAAPMHGTLLSLSVAVGDRVAAGDQLAILEAMKMQHEILSPVTGTVVEIASDPGRQVKSGTLLIVVEPMMQD